MIELNGAEAGSAAIGLRVSGGQSVIRGLAINKFRDGVQLVDGGANRLESNYVGIGLTDLARGNRFDGVAILDSPDNMIEGNVISGNGRFGLAISNVGSMRNTVISNRIGTDVQGLRSFDTEGQSLGNGDDGLLIAQEALPGKSSASWNVIGGTAPGEGNVISGNGRHGIDIFLNAHHNIVQGNFIGTDVTGTTALPNRFAGVTIGDSPDNVIGVTPDHLVAAMGPGLMNIISGNSENGVDVVCAGSVRNVIAGNYIGIDSSGSQPLGNLSNGILVSRAGDCAGIPSDNTVGPMNVVSANRRDGVQISFGATATQVFGNFVGTDASGMRAATDQGTPLGNARHGVSVFDSLGTHIGLPSLGNVIGGNAGNGIFVGAGGLGTGSRESVILDNGIGTDQTGNVNLGNSLDGLAIVDSSDTQVGGVGANNGNRIANNLAVGISVKGTSSSGNSVRRNSIYSNIGLGIDLGGDGEDANDPGDADSGPNGKQNTPEISSVRIVDGGLDTEIKGFLHGTPATTFDIEFFSNKAATPQLLTKELGEGGSYLPMGLLQVNVPASGKVEFTRILPGFALPLGEFITATATDPTGDTSEFSHDADSDSLYDGWETQGVDGNGDGTSDIILPGANPLHKDVYVEVDAMLDSAGKSLGFTPREYMGIVTAFANAPNDLIRNPDLKPGVALHLNSIEDNLPNTPFAAIPWADFDALKINHFGQENPLHPSSAEVKKAKSFAYHYAIIADTIGPDPVSGISEFSGNDMIVALGAVGAFGAPGGTALEREGTFMHELGHNLGLTHSGDEKEFGPDGLPHTTDDESWQYQYKPNYHSVMNYSWQYPVPCNRQSWELNYSNSEFPPLDEQHLSEPDGIGGHIGHKALIGPVAAGVVGLCDPAHPNIANGRVVAESGPVDWNGDGDSIDVNVKQDINQLEPLRPATAHDPGTHTEYDILTGHEDWSHLKYHFRESDYSTDGVHGLIGDELPVRLFQHNLMEVLGNNNLIEDGDTTASATDSTDFGAASVGESVTRSFIIKNRGNIDLNLTGNPVVEVVGKDADAFNVTVVPAVVVPGFDASTTFEVRFQPMSPGSKVATLKIASDAIDDFTKDPYNFALAGTGLLPPPILGGGIYTIHGGDSLWEIARRIYGEGDLWTKIWAANPQIMNPNLIYPGHLVSLPKLPASQATAD